MTLPGSRLAFCGRLALAGLAAGALTLGTAAAQTDSAPEGSAAGAVPAAAESESAQPVGDSAPNSGKVSLATGVDVGTAYFFRGIKQEAEGFIAQPFLESSVTLFEGSGDLRSLAATAGVWNSLHSGPTGTGGPTTDPKVWYENDFYTTLAVGFASSWEASLTYTAYMSPNHTFSSVKETALSVRYDGLGLSPSALVAFELDGQADGGLNEGTYLELSVEPGVPLGTSAVSLAVPLTVGLSLSDYYEDALGQDHTFGYFNMGVVASAPLSFISPAYGSLEVTGGVQLLFLGDSLKAINAGDGVKLVGVFGISLGY